jgi:hypothetical protein
MARAHPETELRAARVRTAETLRMSREWREEQEQKLAGEAPVLDAVRRLEASYHQLAAALMRWCSSAAAQIREDGRA